ncbi:MAG: helix-turn-helix domain-containing protein [Acidobacteriota bacterium]|jgi:excisionase family DNA binding protein
MSQARKLQELDIPAPRTRPEVVDATEGPEEILTAREAQRFLKIGRTKLWDLTRSHEIPAYRVGRGDRSSLRYKRSELMRWLEANRVGKPLR